MLKFHLKSKWKVLTDNHRVEQWSSRLKDPEFCLVGTFLCFLVVFTAFPKILVIGKKVLVRTSPFLTVMLHFWEDKDTSLVLPYVKHKKETGGQQHSQLKPTLQWPLQGPCFSSRSGRGHQKPGVTLQKKTCKNVTSIYSAQKMGSLFFNSAIPLPFLHLNFMIPQSRNKM